MALCILTLSSFFFILKLNIVDLLNVPLGVRSVACSELIAIPKYSFLSLQHLIGLLSEIDWVANRLLKYGSILS